MTHWNMPVEHSIEDLCTALAVLGMFLEHSRSDPNRPIFHLREMYLIGMLNRLPKVAKAGLDQCKPAARHR
jgi:hypothetical protein